MRRYLGWRVVIRLLFSILVGSIFLELLSEYEIAAVQKLEDAKIEPYYTWTFCTPEGRQVGSRRGILKLVIHPQLVYANFPNQKTSYFTINSKGYRGPEIAPKAGRKRVILLGGSAAFGTGLKHDDETFAHKLQAQLSDTEMINAGVIGYKSGQEVTSLLIDLIDLEPDLIIAFDGWNDCYIDIGSKWQDLNEASSVERHLNQLNGLVYAGFISRCANLPQVVFAKSTYFLNNRIRPTLEHLFSSKPPDIPMWTQSTDEESRIRRTEVYCRNVSKMQDLAKSRGVNFICVLQPSKTVIAKEAVEGEMYQYLCVEAKKYFSLHGIDCLDLNLFPERIKKETFMDEVHLNEPGNQAVADILAEEFRKRKLLESGRNQDS